MKHLVISNISFFMKSITLILLSSLLIMVAIDLDAAPITFAFDGYGDGLDPGTNPISGYYTFDSASPDRDSNPTTGNYALSYLNFSWGSLTGNSNDGTIIVFDGINGPTSAYQVHSNFTGHFGQEAVSGTISLVRTCESSIRCYDVFDSDALPLTPPQGLSFDYSHISMHDYPTGAGPYFFFHTNSISVVPEPMSSFLFLSGAGTLAVRRLFKRKPA